MYILEVANHYPNKKYPLHGIFQRDQAIALANEGCDVIYAALDLRSIRRIRPFGFSKQIVDGLTVYTLSLYLGNLPSFIFNPISRFAFKLLYNKIIKKNGKPKLIHAHFLEIAQSCINVVKKEKIPFFITEHSSTVQDNYSSKKLVPIMKKTYSLANTLITVSDSLAKSIENNTGIKSKVIYNIVDNSNFRYSDHKHPEDKFTFASCGHLNKNKGFFTLIHAFAKHIENYPKDKLIIFGGGEEEQALKDLAKNLKIGDNVTFALIKPREEIAKAYEEAQIFILLSKLETFGVVYIEAMASGLPVIATRCGGPENFVNDDVGLVIDCQNVEQAVNAMDFMRSNYNKYDNKKISEYANKMFSPETIAKQLIETFNSEI